MILRIKKLAVIEDASPDNVVNLTAITEGVDGAAAFGLTNEHELLEAENGQAVLDRADPTLDVRVLKPSSSDITTLEGWADNRTDVYISALTLDGGYFFGDRQTTSGAVKITTNEDLSDNDVYAFQVQRQTTPGFDPDTGLHQNGFWAGSNLLGGYEWADADGGGTADGWSATGFTTTSFSSGTQTLEADTTQRDFERALYLPFEGQQLTFSINNDSRSGSYATEQIEIEFLDSSDSVISSSTTTFSSTGRKTVTDSIPANTVQVVCRLSLQASSGTVTNDVSDPALKLGTDSTYSLT